MAVPSHWIATSPLIPATVCSILGIALYLNTLDCGLCFDDVSAITTNQDLRPDTPWSNLLWNDFWGTPMDKEGSHKSYRPLTVFTFKLNYLIHSTDPLGYHIVNILLHGAVCFYFVLICNLAVFQGGLNSHSPPAATALWISGICFAVHPIHTEAVAGVVGRAETLSAMFFLACFHCYWNSLSTGRVLWLLASLVMCLCSVLSKEQGVTALAVCLCYEYFIFNKNTLKSSVSLFNTIRRGQNQPLWLRRFCINMTMLVSFLLAVMFFRVKIMKAELPVFTVHDNPAVGLSTPYRQLHWLYLVFQNVWLLLTPSQLCADWTMGTVPLIQSLIDPRNILTAATFLCIVVLGLYSISNTRPLNNGVHFGLLLMILPFIPASNLLFPVGFVVAERILYVPSMGYSILLAIGFRRSLIRCRSKSPFLSLLVKLSILWLVISHGCKTIERNRDWLSAETLFASAIHINPRNGKLFNNLGHHHESLGNHTYAETLFRKAAEVQPDDVGAYINLGRVLNALNKPFESEQAYRKAIQLMPSGTTFRVAPSHINVYFNLANLIRQDNQRLEESLTLYQRAISMKPDFSEAYMNMGDVYLKLNKTSEAKRAFRNAIKHKEDYSDAYFNLATISLQLKEVAEAEEGYRTALRYNPDHALSLYNLGMMLSEQRSKAKLPEAKKLLSKLLKLQPENDRGHFQLGIVYTELGELNRAVDSFQTALDINPTYRAALYNQAFLLYRMEQTEKAFKNLLTLRKHHPDHAKGMQILGDIYMLRNEVDEAINAYLLCLQTNPNHVTAIHNLGVAMTKKGDFVKAVQYFSLAIKLQPNHEPSKKHLEGAKMEMQRQLKN